MSLTMSMNSLLKDDKSNVDEDSNNNMNSGNRGSVRRRMVDEDFWSCVEEEDPDYWSNMAGSYHDDVAYKNAEHKRTEDWNRIRSSCGSSSGLQEIPFGLEITAVILLILAAVFVLVLPLPSSKKKSSSYVELSTSE